MLYHDADPTAQSKLADLKVQREQLLSRYKPDAQPVKDMDAQIAQLEAGIAAGRTQSKGAERTGVNPVYQTFQTEKLQLAAEVDGLRQTGATLTDEMSRLTERRLRLARLEPQYQALSLDRDALQTNVKDLAAKADESEASDGIAAGHQRQHPHRRARPASATGQEPAQAGAGAGADLRRLHAPSARDCCGCSRAPACRRRPPPGARSTCPCWALRR